MNPSSKEARAGVDYRFLRVVHFDIAAAIRKGILRPVSADVVERRRDDHRLKTPAYRKARR